MLVQWQWGYIYGNCNDVEANEIFFHQIEFHMVKLVSKLVTHVHS